MRWALFPLLVVLAIGPIVGCAAQPRDAGPPGEVATVDRVAHRSGYLREGESEERVLSLHRDHLYHVALEAGHESARFSVTIYNRHGEQVHHVHAEDASLRTEFHAHAGGLYAIEVRAVEGHGEYALEVRDLGHP